MFTDVEDTGVTYFLKHKKSNVMDPVFMIDPVTKYYSEIPINKDTNGES